MNGNIIANKEYPPSPLLSTSSFDGTKDFMYPGKSITLREGP